MKDDRRPVWTPDTQALDQIVREAKDDFAPPELDWSAMEARLVSRVTNEAPAVLQEVRASSTFGSRAMRVGAGFLAAAAAIALVVHHDGGGPIEGETASITAEPFAGSVRWTEGNGEVRVGGLTAQPGQALRAGDTLEADGARVVLERPRKVAWLLEKDDGPGVARARVKSASESLVLALDEGAIEAQVVPVPSGEAFAVDVAADGKIVRVAVHGTHLRVQRAGSRITVDLNEGVVSIGVPPRTGVTYGTLVTAPAHVELDVTDLENTLRVDHNPSAVRAPIPVASHEAMIAAAAKDPPKSANVPPPSPAAVNPAAHPTVAIAEPAGPVAPPAAASKQSPPREAIIEAVRGCALLKSSPGAVRVTLTTKVKLSVAGDGTVKGLVFDPPLQGDIQFCSAQTIYQTKMDETGAVTIPVEFSY
ncbi:MAG TPA: hypothetical protein VIF62_30435 [Labilithrix sp.]